MKPAPSVGTGVGTGLHLAAGKQAARNNRQEAVGFGLQEKFASPFSVGSFSVCGHYYESSSEIGHSSVRKKKKSKFSGQKTT